MRTPLWSLIACLLLYGCGEVEPGVALKPSSVQVAGQAAGAAPAADLARPEGLQGQQRNKTAGLGLGRPKTKILMDPPSIGLPSVHGWVRDVRTGRGIANQVVRLNLGEGRLQETRTDDTGAFRLEPVAETNYASIHIQPELGWRWLQPRPNNYRRLTTEEHDEQLPILLEVAENREGNVAGIAVDSVTGEPLAFIRFRITYHSAPAKRARSGGTFEDVRTDAQGAFACSRKGFGGNIHIKALDGGPKPVSYGLDYFVDRPAGDPWRIKFLAAPTFEVLLEGEVPVDPTELRVWLLWPSSAQTMYETPLLQREDGTLWVRPPGISQLSNRDMPLVLAVGTPDGMLLGTRDYHYGPVNEPLLFNLQGTGGLIVKLPSEKPKRFESAEFVWRYPNPQWTLEPVASKPVAWAWRVKKLMFLPPGQYLLNSWSREHSSIQSVVSIAAGMTQTQTHEHRLFPGARTVRGRATTALGEPIQAFSLRVSVAGEQSRSWSVENFTFSLFCGTGIDHALRKDDESKQVGTFVLEGVPPGELKVEVLSAAHRIEVSISGEPDGDQEILVREYDLDSGYGFLVRDAELSNEVRWYTIHSRPLDGGEPLANRVRNGLATETGDPKTRTFQWAISSSRMGPVFGDQDDFKLVRDGLWIADVELEASWNPRVLVTDGEGRALPGAEVLLDGESCGRTDSSGMLQLHADPQAMPKLFEVRSPNRKSWIRHGPACLGYAPWIEVTLPLLGDTKRGIQRD